LGVTGAAVGGAAVVGFFVGTTPSAEGVLGGLFHSG